jgi:dipeptidyl aminopeptidase/acylaminoacyl peptidase
MTNYVCEGIAENTFTASHDGSAQTYLVKDFRTAPAGEAPLLVVYLHGANSHQEQGLTAGIYDNAFGRLAGELEARAAVYICPEYRGSAWMGAAAEADLLDILRLAKEQFQPRKTLLMGGSMGGTSALIFGVLHPGAIDGVLALCPATAVAEMFPRFPEQFLASYGGSPQEAPVEYHKRSALYHAPQLARLPVAIIHGTDDQTIPIHHARLLTEELRRQDSPLLYSEIEGGDHNAPINVPLGPYIDFALRTKPRP